MPFWRRQGYEELPALSVRRGELRRSLRYVTAGYVFAVLFIASCGGAHFIVFARMAGFGDLHFGLLAAIPYVATLGQLIASILVERSGLKKFQFIESATIARSLWTAVAALPLLLAFPSGAAVYAVLGILLLSSFAGALSAPAWYTWMGDLIPRRIRGRYLGHRARIGAFIQIPFVMALGVLFDIVSVDGAEETALDQPLFLWAACGIFVLGSVLGVTDILLFRHIRDVLPSRRVPDPPSPAMTLSLRELFVDPLRDRVFRHYVLYGATLTFSVTVGGSFFWLQGMEVLEFNKLAMNVLFLVLPPIAGVLSARAWGKVIDRWGRKATLFLATLGTVPSLLPWLLITRDMTGPVWLREGVNALVRSVTGQGSEWAWITPETPVGAYLLACCGVVIGGATWMGVGMGQENVLMGFADGRGRSKYVAVTAVLFGVGGVLGGWVGGAVASALHGLQADPLGPLGWNNWQVVFLLSMLGRAGCVGWLLGMPDPGKARVRHVIHMMMSNVYNTVTPGLFRPLRIFGWGRSKPEPPEDAEP